MVAKAEDEDPPVFKTKLHFKTTSSKTTPNSSHSKKRKAAPDNTTNGASPPPRSKRKPDFDFTKDEDDPLPRISKVFWPDKYTFKDALFSALADPDDARHWTEVFGSEIHIYPRPRPTMTDDEYASWVREQVYGQVLRETHKKKADEARRERERQQERYRRQREEAERKAYQETKRQMDDWQKYFQDKLDAAAAKRRNGTYEPGGGRNLRSQAPAQRWKDYLAAFQPPPPNANLDLLLLWQQSDVPWPTPSGLERDISEANIRTFVRNYTMKYSEQAAGDWKKAVRQNQYFWHPDKFRQIQARKLEKLSEEKKEEIMRRVTEVSQILNKLAKESF